MQVRPQSDQLIDTSEVSMGTRPTYANRKVRYVYYGVII